MGKGVGEERWRERERSGELGEANNGGRSGKGDVDVDKVIRRKRRRNRRTEKEG